MNARAKVKVVIFFSFKASRFVVLFLPFAKATTTFASLIDEHTNRNYGKAGVFRTTLQIVQFFLCQQQFALPTCIMIIVRTKNIRQYAYSSPILTIGEVAKKNVSTRLAFPKRIDLISVPVSTMLKRIGIYQFVIECGTFILNIYRELVS